MGIFDHQSDKNVSAKDLMWFDELDNGGGGSGGEGGCGCATIVAVALGIIIGVILVIFTLT